MELNNDQCYSALLAHDARFDGQFFVGVSSTRIYCRPVCTVKPPMRKNCTFYPSAAAAEQAGYRPCLRCRPELAPGNASVDAAARLAQSAASHIEDGYLTDTNLDALAAHLGVTDRHLRRVFAAEFGVSPVDYAQTQRLLLAKRLLTDTQLPVIDVAMAAGFGSLRRFNALFLKQYRLKPSSLRKTPEAATLPQHTFELAYRPPYAWDAQLEFLADRCIEGVECVANGEYRRLAAIRRDNSVYRGWLAVKHSKRRHTLRVTVSNSLAALIPSVLGRVKRVFDLACRPDEIMERLGPIAVEPGLRLPGAFDGFELAVRAVLGQQVTVRAARTLAGRFAKTFGDKLDTPFVGLSHTFPGPERIAESSIDAICGVGIVGGRARAIRSLAEHCASGEIVLDPAADAQHTMQQLRAIKGIGEWTAQYIAMRALGWPDAFPHTDYGVMKALGEKDPKRVLEIAEQWRPWRAYATMHLWRSLGKQGNRIEKSAHNEEKRC
jgi:AraC family transcriptional regulator of adaptative response / DNA-3-methyladenine glycosylase II